MATEIKDLLEAARNELTANTYQRQLAGSDKAKYEKLIQDAVDKHLQAALKEGYKSPGNKYGVSEDMAVDIARKIAKELEKQTKDKPWDGKIDNNGARIEPAQAIEEGVLASAHRIYNQETHYILQGGEENRHSAMGVAKTMDDITTVSRLTDAFKKREQLMQDQGASPADMVVLLDTYIVALQKYAKTVGTLAAAYEKERRPENDISMREEAVAIVDDLKEVIAGRIALTKRQKEYSDAVNKAGIILPDDKELKAQEKAEKKIVERYEDATQKRKVGRRSPFRNEPNKPAKDAFDYLIAAIAATKLDPKERDALSQTHALEPLAKIASTLPEEKYAGLSSVVDPDKDMGIGGKNSKTSSDGKLLSGANLGLGAAALAGLGLVGSAAKSGSRVNPQTGQTEQKKGSTFARVTKVTLGLAVGGLAIAAVVRGKDAQGIMEKVKAGVQGVPGLGRWA